MPTSILVSFSFHYRIHISNNKNGFHHRTLTITDAENSTLNEIDFRKYLSKFLYSQFGGKYQRNFRFENNTLSCGVIAPPITMASIDFTFSKFSSPYEWIPGMDGAKKMVADEEFDGFATIWSEVFATWVTDKVISQEVLRNLILALICVMGMTAFLIAEPQTCLWILMCVLLTLLDVCGFMYYWGLTIDIVSCIGECFLYLFFIVQFISICVNHPSR